jgi:transcription termination factor Rho
LVILLDSITRLSRAYNLTLPPGGRTLSGGLDPAALYMPKKFFGAARNVENGGSLTILATALIDTGSKMDDVIFEEFKGTGNMELVLDRRMSEKRIFPAIDILRSGTRREEMLLTPKELAAMYTIRELSGRVSPQDLTEQVTDILSKSQDNNEFVTSITSLELARAEAREKYGRY